MSDNLLTQIMGRDMAVDLGTANTLVYVRGRGIVLNEPSVVAINTKDGRPLAVGAEAKRMIGRTPAHIQAIRPLADGVIADFDICEKMLRYFIQKVHTSKWSKPRMVICVPSGITGVEQRAVQEAAEYAGARKPVHIIEEPMAAAIGADLPVHEPSGNMIVDIGGGDLVSGLPRTIQLTTEHVREAMAEPVNAIIDAVKTTLDKTPPELAADIMEDGITITGGGALLGGLDQRLAHETGMPIRVAPEPLYSVVIGSGPGLENIDAMRGLMSLG